jgi:O-antigen/teichoic acid export membrane protein
MAAVTEPAADEPDSEEAKRQAERKADSKAAGIFVYSRTGVALLQVALLPILTRLCDKLEVAYVQALVVLYVGAVGIGSLGLPDAVFYFLGRNPERSAAIVRQTSALLLMAAGPVIAVVCVAGVHMSNHELHLIPALPWLALMLVLELPTQPAINQLLATGYPRAAASLYVGFEVARTFAILIPVVLGLPLSWIPVFMAGTGFLRLLAHVVALRRVFPLPTGEIWRTRRDLWAIFGFAFPAGLAGMVGKLNPVIDKYVVTVMLGAEELALYAAAAIELPLITAIPFAIGAVMQVRYVRLYSTGQTDQLRALWYSTVEKTALIVVPLTTLFLVIADDLVILIATREYADAATPFRIFTLIMLHRVAAYGPMLQAIGRIRMLIVTSSIIVLTNLILTVPLTYAVGYNGAAIATAVAYMPAWGVSLYFIGQAWGSGIRTALPWRFYGKCLVVALVTGAATYAAMTQVSGSPIVRIVIATAGFAAVFLVAGRATGVVSRADMAYLRGWISFGAIK